MVEFKIVVSDPEAKAGQPELRVKVRGDPELEFKPEHKEKRELPPCKVNPKLLEKLGARHGIITFRFRREDKKITYTCKAVVDESLKEDEAVVSLEWLGETLGAEEAEGVVFRAKTWQLTVSGPEAERLIGRKIGDTIDGSIVGLKGYKLEIRGGSDYSGFPMHPAIEGQGKRRVLLSGPPGFHPREKGERRRKMVRGNTIGPEIVQVNTMIVYE